MSISGTGGRPPDIGSPVGPGPPMPPTMVIILHGVAQHTLRTCEGYPFFLAENNFKFEAPCRREQIDLPNLVRACAPYSELPSIYNYHASNQAADAPQHNRQQLSRKSPQKSLLPPEKSAKPGGGQNQLLVKQEVLSTSAMDPNRTIAEDPSMMDDDSRYQVSGRSACFI